MTTILLVEPDNTVRPILRDNLHGWGYQVIVTLDAVDALERTKGGNEPFDLVLLNQFEQSIEQAVEAGRQIRHQAALSSRLPIVITAEQYGTDLEGQNIQVGDNEYVTYLEDGQQLKQLLYQLCPI